MQELTIIEAANEYEEEHEAEADTSEEYTNEFDQLVAKKEALFREQLTLDSYKKFANLVKGFLAIAETLPLNQEDIIHSCFEYVNELVKKIQTLELPQITLESYKKFINIAKDFLDTAGTIPPNLKIANKIIENIIHCCFKYVNDLVKKIQTLELPQITLESYKKFMNVAKDFLILTTTLPLAQQDNIYWLFKKAKKLIKEIQALKLSPEEATNVNLLYVSLLINKTNFEIDILCISNLSEKSFSDITHPLKKAQEILINIEVCDKNFHYLKSLGETWINLAANCFDEGQSKELNILLQWYDNAIRIGMKLFHCGYKNNLLKKVFENLSFIFEFNDNLVNFYQYMNHMIYRENTEFYDSIIKSSFLATLPTYVHNQLHQWGKFMLEIYKKNSFSPFNNEKELNIYFSNENNKLYFERLIKDMGEVLEQKKSHTLAASVVKSHNFFPYLKEKFETLVEGNKNLQQKNQVLEEKNTELEERLQRIEALLSNRSTPALTQSIPKSVGDKNDTHNKRKIEDNSEEIDTPCTKKQKLLMSEEKPYQNLSLGSMKF